MNFRKEKLRVFVDTSVFGGCFDKEFEKDSRTFFDLAQQGKFKIVISNTIIEEINNAPKHITDFFYNLSFDLFELVEIENEIIQLRDAYINQKVVSEKSFNDAEHIATATISNVDLIVSWNFKHIVHFQKIKGFNGVNLIYGYQSMDIRSPREVIYYEK